MYPRAQVPCKSMHNVSLYLLCVPYVQHEYVHAPCVPPFNMCPVHAPCLPQSSMGLTMISICIEQPLSKFKMKIIIFSDFRELRNLKCEIRRNIIISFSTATCLNDGLTMPKFKTILMLIPRASCKNVQYKMFRTLTRY
jgi:hypothetical protein